MCGPLVNLRCRVGLSVNEKDWKGYHSGCPRVGYEQEYEGLYSWGILKLWSGQN